MPRVVRGGGGAPPKRNDESGSGERLLLRRWLHASQALSYHPRENAVVSLVPLVSRYDPMFFGHGPEMFPKATLIKFLFPSLTCHERENLRTHDVVVIRVITFHTLPPSLVSYMHDRINR
jgi:hypothetical protein